jgi:uncharacterized protein (TIGR03083 family)
MTKPSTPPRRKAGSVRLPGLEPLAPIDVAELFGPLHRSLIALLRGLQPAQWERPTVAGDWRVKDVAAHLLDGDLRKLSGQRDGHSLGAKPVKGYRAIVELIDGLNASGVEYGRRLSPRLLTDLLEITGRWVTELVESLDPRAPSWISVLWAGEETSENWLDVGREYTERWHHQMQIRDAVGAPGLLGFRWLRPLLDLSVRALPPAYAGTEAPPGSSISLVVNDLLRMAWTLVREGEGWQLYRGHPPAPTTTVTASPATAWRLFYNALPVERAKKELTIEGEAQLAEPLLRTRSVMVRTPGRRGSPAPAGRPRA